MSLVTAPLITSSLPAFFQHLDTLSIHRLLLFGLEPHTETPPPSVASEPAFLQWLDKGGSFSQISSPPRSLDATSEDRGPHEDLPYAIAFFYPPSSLAELRTLATSAQAIFFPKAWMLDTSEAISFRARTRHLLSLLSVPSPSLRPLPRSPQAALSGASVPSPSLRPLPRSSQAASPAPEEGFAPKALLQDLSLPVATAKELETSTSELQRMIASLLETGEIASFSTSATGRYLLPRSRRPQPSRALSFWLASSSLRPALWQAYLSLPPEADLLPELPASEDTPSAATWERLGAWITPQTQDQRIALAARCLAVLESRRSPSCLLLWEWVGGSLGLPGLSPKDLFRLLPPPHAATPAFLVHLCTLLQQRKYALHVRPWRDLFFALPPALALPELREPFLRYAAPLILKAQTQDAVASLLPIFLHYRPSGEAFAWALHLAGQEEEALRILKSKKERTPSEEARLAAIILAIPKQLYREKTPWLRWLIEKGPAASSQEIRDRVYRILADRKELSVTELASLALWAEESKDHKRAYQTRLALHQKQPDDPAHLAALSSLALQLGKLEEHLQWAFQATRLDPRRFPMDRLLASSEPLLFSDLTKLRLLLIDLPALPAVSKIEEELTLREEAARSLAPQLRAAEAALQASSLHDARQIAKQALQSAGKRTPPRFAQILSLVDQTEESYKTEIETLRSSTPTDAKARITRLETIADEAASKGFLPLAQDALRTLTLLHPKYGLGFLRLARLSSEPSLRFDAFAKAVQLAKTPEQRKRNLTELAHALDKADSIESLLSSLLPILQAYPDEAPGLEDLLLLVIEKRGALPSVSKPIQDLLLSRPQPSFLKYAREAFDRVGSLDPWKRTLMSVKLRKAAS